MGGLCWYDVIGRDLTPSIANRYRLPENIRRYRAERFYVRWRAKDYRWARAMDQSDKSSTLDSTKDRHGERAAT